MVDSVGSFNPIAFIHGINDSITGAGKSGSSSQTGSTGSDNGSSSSTGGTTSSSTSTLGLSSDILSLLQGSSSSSQTGVGISTLLGNGGAGVSSSEPLAGVYNSFLYNVSTAQPLTNAVNDTQQALTQTQTQNNPVQALLANYNNATNAYNQTLLKTAQSIAAANNYGPGGTPLVA